MEVELIEIRDFLADHPPFDQLPAEVLDTLPKQLAVRYLRRERPFPPPDVTIEVLYLVRRGAIEMRNADGRLVDRCGEGDLCTLGCGIGSEGEVQHGTTLEDSLLYLLPCERLHQLRSRYPDFDHYFSHTPNKRIRQAVDGLHGEQGMVRLMAMEVAHLLKRKPVVVAPATSIREAARLMTSERVSAVLISEGQQLLGIVTDRDLRRRCIAAGRDYNLPIREIMTEEVVHITPETPAFEALLVMTRQNIHHIPVVDRSGVVGLISNTDLIRHQSKNSIYLVGDIHKARDRQQLAQIGQQIPDLQIDLIHAGVTAWHLGQAISSITDALSERLLHLATERLGPPPIPYVWLAIGSHARREQSCRSDQDHALLLSDDYRPEEHADYFSQLAEFVREGLNRCGLPDCPGRVMASNPEWRQPLQRWRDYFDHWIRRPERRALMLASNFFDMRPLHGSSELYQQLRSEILPQAQHNGIFLAHLAATALSHRPPLGFFRNLVLIHDGKHDNTVNLKHQGIIPITDLARLFALAEGLPPLNSVERLRAAAEVGAVSRDGFEGLEDALEFISILRARHQVEQLKRGQPLDHYLSPEALTKQERGHLKDAFAAIATLQQITAQRYQTETLL